MQKGMSLRDEQGNIVRDPQTGRPVLKLVDMTADEITELEATRLMHARLARYTPIQFLDRYSAEDQLAIASATLRDHAVKLAYDRLMVSQSFILEDAQPLLSALSDAGVVLKSGAQA